MRTVAKRTMNTWVDEKTKNMRTVAKRTMNTWVDDKQ